MRVTVYDAKTSSKVFNTIDITGNANIAATSNISYFADNNELIPKTTWLSYVSSTYNSVSESDMTKFNNCVISRSSVGIGYAAQYVPELASIDIVSVNNTSHLEAIKNLLGSKEFLVHLSSLLGGTPICHVLHSWKIKILEFQCTPLPAAIITMETPVITATPA